MDFRIQTWMRFCLTLGFPIFIHCFIVPKVFRDSRFFSINQLSFGLEDGKHPNCTVDHLQGLCSFSLECLAAGGYPLGVCRKGFQFGSCCTQRTTRSVVNVGVKQIVKDQECGKPIIYPELDSRIVNGSMTSFGQIPWVVSLRIYLAGHNSESFHFCGGTLLNSEWIITSAHCIYYEDTSQLVIRLGEYNTSSTTEPYSYVERKMKLKIIHKDFRIKDFYSDIALVKMDEPVTYQPNIQPICLPGTENLLEGQSGIVSGWGRIKEGSSSSSQVLRTVSLPIMKNSICEKMFLKGKVREQIHELFMCAGFEDGASDACTGDSGGPMQIKGRDGNFFLAGIVSWGYGCSRPYKPGVYTRISKFVPWIVQKLETAKNL